MQFGFYNEPQIMLVQPKKTNFVSYFHQQVKFGKITSKEIPKFKKFLAAGFGVSINRDRRSKTVVDREDFLLKKRTTPFHENPYFSELYQLLKKIKHEILESLDSNKQICFEAGPIDYSFDDRQEGPREIKNLSRRLYNLIQQTQTGVDNIKGTVNSIRESKEFEKLLLEAFTKGLKPPIKLSETEKAQLLRLVEMTKEQAEAQTNNKLLSINCLTKNNC